MIKLRYCFSAPAMLRLMPSSWEKENPDEYDKVVSMINDGIEKLRKDAEAMLPNFGIDLLFNAYTENQFGAWLRQKNTFGFDKLYADSGGLQIVTAGKSIDDSLKASIYKTQTYADYGMCFDEIPAGNKGPAPVDTKSSRSNTASKLYFPDRKHETATKTAWNIREQIEEYIKLGAATKVFYIVQGNTWQDMVDWFEDGTKVLEDHHWDHVAGLALADTCMGNGPLESVDMLVAYHEIRKRFGEEKTKNHIHLLGLGSVSRLSPLIHLQESGLLPDGLTVSFDSTTFSMSYFMGRFLHSDGTKIQKNPMEIRRMFNDIFDYYQDIYEKYIPGLNKDDFINHVVGSIRSVADSINNSEERFAALVRANITLSCCWQVLGFIKHLKTMTDRMSHDHSPIGMLRMVNSIDTYNEWRHRYGNRVKSSRISRDMPHQDISSLFN